MIRRRVLVADSVANAIYLDEYQPYNLTYMIENLHRKRTVCDRCDGECQFEIWKDADTLAAAFPCTDCRGTGFTLLPGWHITQIRRRTP